MDDFLDVDFGRSCDGGWRRVHCIAISGNQHFLSRPVQRLPPRLGDKVDVIITIQRGQVAGQCIIRAAGSDPVAAIIVSRPSTGHQRYDIKLEIALPVGRLTAKLFHITTQNRVNIAVRSHQHQFDGRRRFGTAVATRENQRWVGRNDNSLVTVLFSFWQDKLSRKQPVWQTYNFWIFETRQAIVARTSATPPVQTALCWRSASLPARLHPCRSAPLTMMTWSGRASSAGIHRTSCSNRIFLG